MLPVSKKAYSIFNWALLAADGLIVLVYVVLATTDLLGTGQFLGTTPITTLIGGIHIAYMMLLYPFIGRKSTVGSSLIGFSLLAINLIILLLNTGSFTSPYFALWLLLIMAVGIYKPGVELGFLGACTIYFFGLAFSNDFDPDFFSSTIVALIATYITGALGFWLWHSRHTASKDQDELSEATDKLTQEQIKSEIIVRSIGDGVIMVDATGKVQLLNPAGTELTGWPEAEAKGIDWKIILPLSTEDGKPIPPDQTPFAKAFAEKTNITRNDLLLLNRSKKKLELSFMASPIFNDNNQLMGGVAVFRDISKQKANERQRDEFISTASHEMRTPVAAIDGYLALALNPKICQIDDKAKMYLRKAQASSKHLGKLFQDLLSTTKLEEGKLPNHPEVFDLSSLVRVVIDELRIRAEEKNLSLALISNPEMHGGKNIQPLYYVDADPERIREVLTNLIDNAIKFSQKGEITVTISGDAQNVTVGVHDQGIGIAPEDLPHLFQKFYRIDNTKTRTIGGTGLGLYLCRTMIEMYNGRMWAESKLGEGSHFYFTLPRISTTQAQEMRAKLKQAKHTIQPQQLNPADTNNSSDVAQSLSNNVE